ncbi:MAG: PIG-L deacetylase family protein [Burkholderiales bacterium]
MESFFVPYVATDVLEARRVAVLAPHADDEIFGCGGALASFVAHGIPVHVAVVSDEDAAAAGETVPLRHTESDAAARVMGYAPPVYWGLKDRFIHEAPDLTARIARWVSELGADLLLAPSCWEMHPDHRAVAEAAIQAVITLGGQTRLAMYEVGVPLFPNILLDITPYQALKAQAMACFTSQLARQRYDVHIASLNQYRTYTLPGTVQAAEAYLMLTANELGTLGLNQWPAQATLALHQAKKVVAQLRQDRLSIACDQLRAQLTAMRHSTSWRVSAPLRCLGRLVRRWKKKGKERGAGGALRRKIK